MLASTLDLIHAAEAGRYAVGAFNVYNLEGVKAVVQAAESERSPAMLALHPASLRHGGQALVALCMAAADEATVPVSVHLDHSTSAGDIANALQRGLRSVMADGTHLSYEDNLRFSREMAQLAHANDATIEAELGKLSGSEDGLTVPELEAKMTDPMQAGEFVRETGVDAFAVCIGNVHGRYRSEPALDFARLAAIRKQVNVPLVLARRVGFAGRHDSTGHHAGREQVQREHRSARGISRGVEGAIECAEDARSGRSDAGRHRRDAGSGCRQNAVVWQQPANMTT